MGEGNDIFSVAVYIYNRVIMLTLLTWLKRNQRMILSKFIPCCFRRTNSAGYSAYIKNLKILKHTEAQDRKLLPGALEKGKWDVVQLV